MTIAEFHQAFRFGLDKMDGLNYPNFLPEEIDLLLNQAQERLVKQRYGKTNPKRTSFEEEQKRTEDLKELIVNKVSYPLAADLNSTVSNSFSTTLEDNHWFMIWEKAIVSCTTCNETFVTPFVNAHTGNRTAIGIEVEVRPTSHMEVEKVRKDAFKGPDKTKVLRLMYQNRVELIPSSDCAVTHYIYRYIKKPQEMDINTSTTCELSEHLHQEIVSEAIKIALEGIEAKRIQTFPIIDNLKE